MQSTISGVLAEATCTHPSCARIANGNRLCTICDHELPPEPVRFEVLGTPAPKGSSRAMVIKGRAIMVPSGSDSRKTDLRSWDALLREAARDAIAGRVSDGAPLFRERALFVSITFRLKRPAGHWGKHGLKPSAPNRPATKPDIDKLARSTLDALTGVVFDDDSRIVEIWIAKRYAQPGDEGATIAVEVTT